VELERHGFYPPGGGAFGSTSRPARRLYGFDLCERGGDRRVTGRALLSNLPAHIARREIDTDFEKTGWEADCCRVDKVRSAGPGNVVFLEVESAHVTEVFTGFGQQGVKAERVAGDRRPADARILDGRRPIGPYLADQLCFRWVSVRGREKRNRKPVRFARSQRAKATPPESRLQAVNRESSPAEAGTPTAGPRRGRRVSDAGPVTPRDDAH